MDWFGLEWIGLHGVEPSFFCFVLIIYVSNKGDNQSLFDFPPSCSRSHTFRVCIDGYQRISPLCPSHPPPRLPTPIAAPIPPPNSNLSSLSLLALLSLLAVSSPASTALACTLLLPNPLPVSPPCPFPTFPLALAFPTRTPTLPFPLFPVPPTAPLPTRPTAWSSSFLAKTWRPRRCVSLPFWWFSRILIWTRWARSTGILGMRVRSGEARGCQGKGG